MEDYENLTIEDYIRAKTDDLEFERVWKANQGLVLSTLNHVYLLPHIDIEIYKVVLLEGFAQAVKTFEPDRDFAFSTYAFTCMKNEIANFNKSQFGKMDILKRRDTLSLNKVVNKKINSGQQEEIELGDNISDNSFEEWEEEMLSQKVDPNRLMTYLSEKEREIIISIAEGKMITELAKERNCSHQCISQIVDRARTKMKKMMKKSLAVGNMVSLGMDLKDISYKMGFPRVEYAEYFYEVFKYLYIGGKRPKDMDLSRLPRKYIEIGEERE